MKKRPSVTPRQVFIVEDHPVFREGLTQILNREAGLAVCGSASNATEARKAIPKLQPDLVLVDIGLPGKSGLELIKEVRVKDKTVKLLVISMHDEALYADRVLRAGGDGYIMKQEDPEEIVHAIRDVLSGHIYVSEEVFAVTAKPHPKGSRKVEIGALDQLTDRELEILESLGRGRTNQDIARQLKLTVGQMVAHATRIQKKLSLPSANALIRYAVCWVESGV